MARPRAAGKPSKPGRKARPVEDRAPDRPILLRFSPGQREFLEARKRQTRRSVTDQIRDLIDRERRVSQWAGSAGPQGKDRGGLDGGRKAG